MVLDFTPKNLGDEYTLGKEYKEKLIQNED
jgi:hypothetical protein